MNDCLLKQLMNETRKYQDMPIVMQRLNECGHIDNLYSLYRNIIIHENEFMVTELQKIMVDSNNNKKKVNLNKQIQLNAQIFKQNFEIISNSILGLVFNEVYEQNQNEQPNNSVLVSQNINNANNNSNSNANANNNTNPNYMSKQQLQNHLLESQLINSTIQQLQSSQQMSQNIQQQPKTQNQKYQMQLQKFNDQVKQMSNLSYTNPQNEIANKKSNDSIEPCPSDYIKVNNINLTLNSMQSNQNRGNWMLNSSKIFNKFKNKHHKMNQSMTSFITNKSKNDLFNTQHLDSEFSFRSCSPFQSTFSKQKRKDLFQSQHYKSIGPKYDINKADKFVRSQSPSHKIGTAQKKTWIDQIQSQAIKKQTPGPKYNPVKKATSKKLRKK